MTLRCVGELEGSQGGEWRNRSWEWKELSTSGLQPKDIRMMTAECPQKTWSICSCPDSLATTLPEDRDYYRLAAHTGKYRRGREARAVCGNSGWTAFEFSAHSEACWR